MSPSFHDGREDETCDQTRETTGQAEVRDILYYLFCILILAGLPLT